VSSCGGGSKRQTADGKNKLISLTRSDLVLEGATERKKRGNEEFALP